MPSPPAKSRSSPRTFILIFVGACMAISATGYWLFQDERASFHERTAKQLLASVQDRGQELATRRAQLDAQRSFLRGTPSVATFVRQYRAGEDTRHISAHLSDWIGKFRAAQSLVSVSIVDPVARTIPFSVGPRTGVAPERILSLFNRSRQQGENNCVEVTGSDSLNILRTLVIAPMDEDSTIADSAKLLMVLATDPANELFPLVQRWPEFAVTGKYAIAFPQDSGYLLVKPAGHGEYSVSLRNRGGTTPSARGMRGERGLVHAVDSLGAPVFAALSGVPGTSWVVVAQIDEDELRGNELQDALGMATGLLVVMGAAGLGLWALWNRRELQYAATELEKTISIEQFNHILGIGTKLNTAVAGAPSLTEFLGTVCKIMVEDAGYVLCVIGLPSADGSTYSPIAWNGAPESIVQGIMLSGGRPDDPGSPDPIRFDFRRGTESVIHDVSKELPPGEIRTEYLQANIRAAIVLPIPSRGTWGGIHLFSSHREFFLGKERQLAQELTGTIASVISRFDAQNELGAAVSSLRESERNYRELVNHMQDGLIRVDNNDRILFVNDAFCRLTGYSAGQLIGRIGHETIMPPPSREIVRQKNATRKAGISDTYELELLTRAGSSVVVLVTGSPVYDDSGQVVGSIGIFTDITERKQSEDLIRRSESNFRTLFESSPAPMLVEDSSSFRDHAIALYNTHGDGLVDYLDSHPDETARMAAMIQLAEVNLPFVELLEAPSKQYVREHSAEFISAKSLPWIARTIAAFASGAVRHGGQLFLQTCGGHEKQVLYAIQAAPGHERTWKRLFLTMIDITERIEIESELRKRDESLRLRSAALEAAANAVVITDAYGAIEWANPAFTRMTGYELAEAAGQNPRDLLKSGVHTPEFYSLMWTTIVGGNVWRGRLTNKRKNGSLYEEEMTITPLREASGEIGHYIAVKQDVTDKVSAEQHLHVIETAIQSSISAIGITDTFGTLIFVNREFIRHWGYSNEGEILGRHISEFAGDPADPVAAFAVLARGESYIGETVARARSGKQFRVAISANPVLSPEGKPLYYMASLVDIEDRKKAEELLLSAAEDLRVSEQKYRSLFTDSPDAIFITTPSGTIVDGNPATLELFAFVSVDAMTNTNFFSMLAREDDRSAFASRLGRDGHFEAAEYEINRTDGGRVFVNASATMTKNDEGAPVSFRFILRDVTRQRSMQQQLLQIQKMDSLGTLAAGIAHDFNNILTIILAHSDVLKLYRGNEAKFSESMETVHSATMRGAALVRQLLTFARKSEPANDLISIAPVIKDLHRLLSETFPKTINIDVQVQSALPLIRGDVTQVHQVLLNLCVNARDAMPAGGTLSISATTQPGTDVMRHYPSATAARYIAVRVSDTGTGMEPETKKRIFEPFFTTKESGKGTGLGLSIVFGAVQSHRGYIDVESTPGLGTEFNVYLPAADEAAAAGSAATVESAAHIDGTEHILVIEDEDPLRGILEQALKNRGYSVYAAADGVEGLALFLKYRDSIKGVITDLGLPRMNGVQVAKKLRTFAPELKILVASGYISPHDREELARLGITEILQKPYVPRNLLARLRVTLDSPA